MPSIPKFIGSFLATSLAIILIASGQFFVIRAERQASRTHNKTTQALYLSHNLQITLRGQVIALKDWLFLAQKKFFKLDKICNNISKDSQLN